MKEIVLHVLDSSILDVNKLHQLSFLTEEDYSIIDSYQTDLGKREAAISQYFKRKYIGKYYLDNKKPKAQETHFNISHSDGLVIFAQCVEYDIGIDIENSTRKIDTDIKRYVTSSEEYGSIKTDEDFFNIWVSKESLVKAIGTGIDRDIKNVPAFPLNGIKEYRGKKYYSHLIQYKDFSLSITLCGSEDFTINIIQEEI